MSARPVVAGNWKMHHGPDATASFFRQLPDLSRAQARVLVFPPALSFAAARESAPAGVELGVQNVYWEAQGAFTGEVSAGMAAEAGARHVLIGHSERRHVFGETDEQVALKTASVLAVGLTPVVCVGETLQERRSGRLEQVIGTQLDAVLGAFADASAAEVMVAYEPVWAIGTGETATPADAQEAQRFLRERLAARLGSARSVTIPILYGGSVKPGNAGELLAQADVDGLLVGGASLEPQSFAQIVAAGG
ncbi:MAG: triose-phosphate isomerase [Gemmatimonadota bacterium]